MYPSPVTFDDFYKSALGQLYRKVVAQRMVQLLSQDNSEEFLIWGHGKPYQEFFPVSCSVKNLVFSWQGVKKDPESRFLLGVSEESLWPLADCSLTCVFVVHTLEYLDNPCDFLREAWRVLKEDGTLLLVVPNQGGLWAHLGGTPLEMGTSYRLGSLSKVLKDLCFSDIKIEKSLYTPPFCSFVPSAVWWESLGESGFPFLPGVFIFQAKKTLYRGVLSKPVKPRGPFVLFPSIK